MTHHDAYDALLYGYKYKTDTCFPSTRYSEITGKDSETMNLHDTKILVDGRAYTPHEIDVTSDCNCIQITATAYLTTAKRFAYGIDKSSTKLEITNVIFNPPATIVFWSDKTKTIVKADYAYEEFDPEKGLAMAIAKKMMGDNKGRYYDIFKHWRKKWDEQNEVKVNVDIPKSSLNDLSEKIKSAFGVPSYIIIDDLVPGKEELND